MSKNNNFVQSSNQLMSNSKVICMHINVELTQNVTRHGWMLSIWKSVFVVQESEELIGVEVKENILFISKGMRFF